MIGPPASLIVTPIDYASSHQTITGVSPEGHLYHFHEFTSSSEGTDCEHHFIWINRWISSDKWETIWSQDFAENESDPFIFWNDKYEVVELASDFPLTDEEYALASGTPNRLEAYRAWQRLIDDPFDFLLKVMTLEVL